MEQLNMERSSYNAWRLLRRLSNDPTKTTLQSNVTADQIAQQLIIMESLKKSRMFENSE